jgi:uncharacterized protein YecT (DUF1311 family)
MESESWRIEVTDSDIRVAKRAWIAARDGDAPEAAVDRLYEDLRMLISAQAQQIADDFRARRAALEVAADCPSAAPVAESD